MLYKGPIVYLWGLFFLCSACTATSEKTAERLNDIAFAYHYRSLDSVRVYSDSVLNNYSSYEEIVDVKVNEKLEEKKPLLKKHTRPAPAWPVGGKRKA